MDRLKLEIELEKRGKLEGSDISKVLEKLKIIPNYKVSINSDSSPIGNEGNDSCDSFYVLKVDNVKPDKFPNLWKFYENDAVVDLRFGIRFAIGILSIPRENIIRIVIKDNTSLYPKLTYDKTNLSLSAQKELIRLFEGFLYQLMKIKDYKIKYTILSQYSEHSGIRVWHYCKLYLIGGESIKSVISKIMVHTGQEKINENQLESIKEKFLNKVSEGEIIKFLMDEGFKNIGKRNFKLLENSYLIQENKFGYSTCWETFLMKLLKTYLPFEIPVTTILVKDRLKTILAFLIVVPTLIIGVPLLLVINFFKSVFSKMRKVIFRK